MLRLAIFISIAAVMGGCAFTPQTVMIEPTVNVAPSQVGGGKSVGLNVVDERPKKSLGTVGASGVGADITIEGDLVASVQKAIGEGLARLGFKLETPRQSADSELRVEIRTLDYIIIRGFWEGTLRVDAGLKAICIRGDTRPYEKLHHGEFAEGIQIVQGKESNAKYINSAVSQAVNGLLSDTELMSCLAK